MIAFLASLIFVAAGQVAPPPPPAIPDVEVVRLLKSNELVEWNSAMRITAAGETRVKQGTSIMATAQNADGSPKAAAPGGLSDTPEQVIARAKKIIAEGNAQIQQALPSLTRLRLAAATRAAELIKPAEFAADFSMQSWDAAVSQAVVRLQQQAHGVGFAQTHFIGGFALLGDGKLSRPAVLTQDVRAAWTKVDQRSLSAVPADGYAYVPGAGAKVPALAKSLTPPTAVKQTGVLWAEFYALSGDSTIGLLFLRLADAHSMQIIGSEVALTDLGAKGPPAVALNCALILRDNRNFVSRLTQSGEWVLGFERSSNPLGSALLTHLCTSQTRAIIAASPYVVIVAGGGPSGSEGIRARWNVVQGETDGSYLAFGVSSQAEGTPSVDVGQMTMKLALPTAKK